MQRGYGFRNVRQEMIGSDGEKKSENQKRKCHESCHRNRKFTGAKLKKNSGLYEIHIKSFYMHECINKYKLTVNSSATLSSFTTASTLFSSPRELYSYSLLTAVIKNVNEMIAARRIVKPEPFCLNNNSKQLQVVWFRALHFLSRSVNVKLMV